SGPNQASLCASKTVTPLSTDQPMSRRGMAFFASMVLTLACTGLAGVSRAAAEPRHAIAMHGEPALPDGFTELPYTNPAAPKGGRMVQGVGGTFDNLNPFIVKGLAAQGIRGPLVANTNVIAGYVVESLMARGLDEPFALYGLVAQTVETNAERSYVTFTLNPA